MRHFVIYRCTDAAEVLPEHQFHLRAASALEHTRRAHYGADGIFVTHEADMPPNQPFQNEQPHRYPWPSPRYVSISTDDDDVDFAPMEQTLVQQGREFAVRFQRIGEGEYDLERQTWANFRELVVLPLLAPR